MAGNLAARRGCPNIANCITTVCTSLSDITCAECQKILYKLYNSDKECARTCSWEDRWCWPGSCGSDNYARDCRCDSESFTTVFDDSQARCQLTKAPEVITCRMQVVDANSDALMSPVPPNVPTHCSNQKDFYGNIQVDRIITNSSFELSVNVSLVPKPEYVTNHAFGVTDVNIAIVIKPILGTENIVKNISLHSDPNSNNPKQLLSFDKVIGNNSPPRHLSNGERICLRFLSRGGGHLVSKNIITRKETEVAFLKTFTVKDLCYHYDNAHPVHCLEQHICTSGLLDIDSRILITPSFQVNVSGWEDPSPVSGNTEYASGIDTYMTNVYEVKQAEPGWLDVGRDPIVISPIKASQPIRIIIPEDRPNPALYAVVLEVKDVANNVKQARRFVMLDNSSMVFARDDKPFYSTTTTTNTAHKWQTNHGALCYSWTDRYYNDKFKDLNLLQPIKPDYHGHITGIYEQISGLLPVSGTENVHGITVFYFSFANDTKTIHTKEKVPNFTSQKICLSPTVNDGETYRFDVEAQDIMKHSYSEYLYTHIDSSRPKIFDIGLTKDGYKLLNVHNSSDLSKMVLEFNALDIHSGLYSADWSLGTSLGGSDIGNGSVGVSRLALNESCPEHSNCYCPSVGPCAHFNFTLRLNSLVNLNTHVGNHNRGYHFTITVTNEARLVMVEHMEVLTDDSPPATGVVREGPAGGLDIDYTSKESFVAHWDGYIDHESGVRLYRVGLTRSCLEQDTFSGTKVSGGVYKDNETAIIETTFKFARFTLPEEGQYFVSVVAYNNAMQPSYPVCSDGILLDKTPPAVVNVTMRSASVIEKVMCSNETAWYISNNLTRYRVNDDMCDEMCRNTSVNKFISILPEDSSHVSNHSIACKIVDKLGIIYLPIDLIHLHWNVIEAESQVHEVYVGIGSTKDSGSAPDLVDFHKSPHKYSYKKRHIGLSDGDEIYIFLKITNSAGLSSVSSIGPVLVDETPPICPPSLPVSIENGSLYTYWDEGTFYDNEQKEPMTTFLYRVGQEDVYVSAFQPMGVPGTANCVTKEKICLTIPLSDLHVYDADIKLTFNIQLHVFNNAGYHCTVDTDTFHLPSRIPPGHGVLYDVTHDLSVKNMQDIDVLISSKEFCVTWQGFEHNDDIAFEVGIGRIPGSDDTTSFHDIPEVDVYCENAKILSYYHRYFVTVRAFTSGGTAVATSDGFTIINSSDITASLRVYDGYGCSSVSRAFPVQQVGTSNIYAPSKTDLHVGHVYTLESNTSITVEKVYCPLGSRGVKCVPLIVTEDPNMFRKFQIYEIDADADDVRNNKDSFYAANIGDKMSWLHEAELDFTAEPVRPGGVILGMGDQPITWFLVRDSNSLNQSCEENPNCVAIVQTFGGFSAFRGVNLENGIMYFICADISDITGNNRDEMPSFQTCGNGFFVDINPPSTGDVTITSERDYIIDQSSLVVHWDGFKDFLGYKTLGYPFTLASFTYCIGSEPLGQDLVAKTNVGLYQSIIIHNPALRPGEMYYATVTAFDHVGHSTSAVSKGVIFDSTPPVIEFVQVGTYLKPKAIVTAEISIHLIGCHDDESGISQTLLGIGSTEHVPDIIDYQGFTGEFASLSNLTALYDGHQYYAVILVTNGAGLSSVAASDAFVIDRSSPTDGVVRDGLLNFDINFQPNTTHGGCNWSGFSDPHSGIRYYSAGLSTMPLGDDVRPMSFTGTRTEFQWTYSCVPGTTYYCTVRACNGAGLCTSVSSNGFTTDYSPPTPGIVHVGFDGHHSRYWAHANSIQVQWFGFVDAESGIMNYEVCVRHTDNSNCDIVPFTNVFMSNMMTNPVNLPQKVPLTVEVKAYNTLNMSVKIVSDSFIVDPTPPILMTAPVLGAGNGENDPQVIVQSDPSLVTLTWKFKDDESPIIKHIVSVKTHHDGHTPVENVYLSTESSHIFTLEPRDWLRPGDSYTAIVTACNEAGLCTSATSNDLLVDPTPPHRGGFEEPLTWHMSSDSNETVSFINLTLHGFKDTESGIKTYYVTVGDSYSGSEISNGLITFPPSGLNGELELVQLILTEHLQSGRQLIFSVWVENNAGLFSDTGKVTVTVIASDSKITYGYLEILKHSCDAEYCNRDCTCAVITQKCHTIDVDTDCKEENKTDDYDLRIHVHHGGKNKQREALSATSACISANWTVTGTRGQGIKRTEWSMGQLDMPIGTGIFDPLLENLWYDIGQRTWVTHCLQGANHLLHDTSYVVYIRAWTSTSDFTVFTSAAVHIDTTHPSVRKGQYIRENLNESCDHDIDFTTTLDTLTACWSGVFSDPQSGIDMYFVALGTIPGGDDVISISKVGQNTSTSWVNLTLSPGTKYYVSVTCINHVGIHTTIVSDGVLVDNERPHAGVVFNTDSFRNGHAQNTRDVGASFWGFDDRHSAIESFYIALQISNGDFTTDNISLKFQHIGLRNTFTFYNTSLVTGQWYRFAVKARDAAGFESDLVYSPRALFDSTPPVHIDITTVSVTEKVASTNGTLYWMKELDDVTGPTVYRLYISSANITSSNLFEVSFENQKQLHSVIMETIGTYTVAISFTSSPFYKGNRSISVLAHDMPIYAEIDLTLLTSDDVTVTGQTNNVIDVQQVSTTELQINGNIIDAESGIRDIYVGLGSNRGGFQMYPLLHVSSSYNILLPVEAPHGQPVHVTITTVSQAGCWSHFHSRPVIMDHTAPIISNTLMTTTFSVDEVQTLTSVKVTWKVTDEQSSYIDCFCEIGTNMMSGILYRGKGKSECETPYTYIQHGTNVFTRIRCLNSANLQQSTLVGPKTVILSAPNVAKVRIAFDTAYDTAFGLPVIPSSSKLTFSWENFDDSYGIKSYSYRIYRGTQGLTEWEKTDLRNYASLDHTGKHDDGIYTVEVKACAYDGLFCQVVNGSVLISGISPSLTGLPAAVTRQDAGLELVWDDAFTIQPSLLPRYTVTVGSERGFVDLVRFVETTEQRHVIIDYFSGSDVFVVIKCSYVTGLFTTFSGKLPVF
ncbi:uncharacterized protein LOC110463804 [Mizuhopecten yessoensis]|uniref:uncharacterized protein LOC110463804 n=1 Tax=Mizuhopecten yessoensis TaxID=6573 RepID=UPI000B458950|nr:uncharacterized protein LOC110463804 [Mizuhopecten yessoensis]